MYLKDKLALTLLIAATVCSSALASDWIDDERVQEFQQPKKHKVAPPDNEDSESMSTAPRRPQQRRPAISDDDGGGMAPSVIDEGDGGENIPGPKKAKGNRLEGNVSSFTAASPAPVAPAMPTTFHMKAAQEQIVEPIVFRNWIEKSHPELKGGLVKQREQVIEVKGRWDDSGHALRSFGLGYTKVPVNRIAAYDLSKAKILIIDCAGEVPTDAHEPIRNFVFNGGFLLTTDWALDNFLQKAIPGFVDWGGDDNPDSRVVDSFVSDTTTPFTKDTVPRAYWKLDKKSKNMRIVNPRKVKVLARSRLMMNENGSGGDLAATFRYGKGRVLHMVGHFDNNSDRAFNNMLPDPAPTIGISLRQAIAANFVAEALAQPDVEPAANATPAATGLGK